MSEQVYPHQPEEQEASGLLLSVEPLDGEGQLKARADDGDDGTDLLGDAGSDSDGSDKTDTDGVGAIRVRAV